ncbi:hypothetical protein AAVH_43689, partial [Aphelenchoides avenae]
GGTCTNKGPDCPYVSYLCKHPIYEQLMNTECPETCGTCGSTSAPGQGCGTHD